MLLWLWAVSSSKAPVGSSQLITVKPVVQGKNIPHLTTSV